MHSTPEDPRLAALEQSVRQLRSELRTAHRMRWAMGLAGAVVLLMAARLGPSVVRAERFELIDHSGGVVGVLSAEDDAPYLHLFDRDGGIALLQVREGRASLELDGQQEGAEPVAEVASEPEPSARVIQLLDEAGVAHAPARIVAAAGLGYVGVEVRCKDQPEVHFLARLEGDAVFLPALPTDGGCTASFRGGGRPKAVEIRGGEQVICKLEQRWVRCVLSQL